MDAKKQPSKDAPKTYVETIREGAIAANIHVSQSPDGNQSHYFVMSRCWKNQTTGKFKYTDRMYPRNADSVAKVAELAAARCEQLDGRLDQDETPAEAKAA
ncbi:MAG: hypothetical protein CMJ58_00180 [Planctomycetaceae bacterium]|nr:hypothetical protein [Planctomycetaceae bacterium]